MITGKAKAGCKVWAAIGGRQIDEIREGTRISANMETGDYIRLVSPVAGWTKKSMVALDASDPTPPPTEPPSTFPPEIYLTIEGETRAYVLKP